MVALRTPNDLPPPEWDGLPTRLIKPHGNDKLFYWARIANAFSIATHKKWEGRRSCVDLFCSYGVNHDEQRELSWGSALLSLQIGIPFDTYIFGDRSPKATAVLEQRIRALRLAGAEIFPLRLKDADVFRQAQEIKNAQAPRSKIVILTGDANEAPLVVKQLLPAFPQQRISLAMLDPNGAHFTWEALTNLTAWERMDLFILFPEDMDLERNLNNEPDTQRLNRYFGVPDWQKFRDAPGDRGRALRELYESRLKTLDYRIGDRKSVTNTRRAPIYKLIFASRQPLGIKLWNEGCLEDPSGQIGMFLGWEYI